MKKFKMSMYPIQVKKWVLKHGQLVNPSNAIKTPVVYLVSSIHKEQALEKIITNIGKDAPVYLVEFPIGNNENLSFSDLAKILSLYLDQVGVSKVHIMAFGFESFIAHSFASNYPERIGKLMVGGIVENVRESNRLILQEGLNSYFRGEKEHFVTSVLLNFFNFGQREKVSRSEDLISSLNDKMSNSDEDITYLKENIERYLEFEGLERSPFCETLIMAGEYDRFTTPYESFSVAKRIPKAEFVIVNHADHLGVIQMQDVYSRLVRRFLTDKPLNRMKDVEVFERTTYPVEKIRMEPRFELNDVAFLDSGNGVFVPINIVDINKYGCKLYTSFKDHQSVQGENKFYLHFPKENWKVELFLFEKSGEGHFRAVFRHCDWDSTQSFESYVDTIGHGQLGENHQKDQAA
tara:strand:- start:63616 stop:64833 length:1218 start_codon:yes stop_codon:yes gene_type:complete